MVHSSSLKAYSTFTMKGIVVTGDCIMLKAVRDLFKLGALFPKIGMFFILRAPKYIDLLMRIAPVP